MRKYCLIGKKLGHSMSPDIHKELFRLSGKEGEYTLIEIPQEEFENRVHFLKSYDGYNITIPYKVDIIPYIDNISADAKRYGAVNCVSNKNGISSGYNTDSDGFLKSLYTNNIPLNKKVLLLGCGGVGRMMALETLFAGGSLTVAVRKESVEKTKEIIRELETFCADAQADIITYEEISGHFHTLLNSTPVGMFPDIEACPVSDEVIRSCDNFFDAIYNPVETVLIKKAKAMGKNAVGGMAMLVYQAVSAHEIWDDAEYNTDDISVLIKEMEDKVERIFR